MRLNFHRAMSRRNFLSGTAVAAAALNIPRSVFAVEKHPLLSRIISIDTHTHPGPLYRGAGSVPGALRDISNSQLTAVVFSIVADGPVTGRAGKIIRKPKKGELYTHTFGQLKKAVKIIGEAGLPIITSADQLEAIKKKDGHGVILAIEGGDFAEGHLEGALSEAYEMGVRVIQPGHYNPNSFTDLQKQDRRHGGLSQDGEKFIREMNRLGMVVDTAHMTKEAVARAIEVSSDPVILSHTLLFENVRKGTRMIGINHAKLIAKSGGCIGTWSVSGGKLPKDFGFFIQQFRMTADAIGVDHVALGTDLNSTSGWFRNYGDLPKLADELLGVKFSEDEVGKMLGGNFLRVFRKVTAKNA